MKRLFVNGSPRGKESNSRLILSWIAEGMANAGVTSDGATGSGETSEPEILDLARTRELDAQRESFLSADEIVMIMPLYTDSMPGLVKRFIDSLADVPRDRLSGKRIAFIVQSGFPEGIQGETLARYLTRLATRCGWINLGTLVKGGIEGIKIMPPAMTKKTRALFQSFGESLARDGVVDPAVIDAAGKPYRLGFGMKTLFRVLAPTGLTNMYWDMNLKQNDAFKRRFDAPYGLPYKG